MSHWCEIGKKMNKRDMENEINSLKDLVSKLIIEIRTLSEKLKVHEINHHFNEIQLFPEIEIEDQSKIHPLSPFRSSVFYLTNIIKIEFDGIWFYKATYTREDTYGKSTIEKFKKIEPQDCEKNKDEK